MGVVHTAEADHRDVGGGRRNGDGDAAALSVVIAVRVNKDPFGCAAGDVGEGDAEVQVRGEVHSTDTGHRAAGAVGLRVIDAAVAGHRDTGVGLTDHIGDAAAGGIVVSVAREAPGVPGVRPGVGVGGA